MKKKTFSSLFFISIFFIILFSSCNRKKHTQKEIVYPVKASISEKKDVPIYIDSTGTVEAINSVDIRPQVEGEIVKIHFQEGEYVKEGDLLFTIDPRPFENALNEAKATLQENLADLYFAKDKVNRYQNLVKDDYISKLEFEGLQTNVLKLEAISKQTQAQIANAKVNLSYCFVTSPINGKSGKLNITKGNLVSSKNNLISIKQISPIYVTFNITEEDFEKAENFFTNDGLKILASFNDLDKNFEVGKFIFLNNSVDKNSGQIILRGLFQNEKKKLWPGQFIKTRIILKTEKDAILVDNKAVLFTSLGPKIFVIKKDERVEMRSVVLGQKEKDKIIIKKGIFANEKIVTEGQLNLSDNVKVEIKK